MEQIAQQQVQPGVTGEESLSTRQAESSRLGTYVSGSVQNGAMKPNIVIAGGEGERDGPLLRPE